MCTHISAHVNTYIIKSVSLGDGLTCMHGHSAPAYEALNVLSSRDLVLVQLIKTCLAGEQSKQKAAQFHFLSSFTFDMFQRAWICIVRLA